MAVDALVAEISQFLEGKLRCYGWTILPGDQSSNTIKANKADTSVIIRLTNLSAEEVMVYARKACSQTSNKVLSVKLLVTMSLQSCKSALQRGILLPVCFEENKIAPALKYIPEAYILEIGTCMQAIDILSMFSTCKSFYTLVKTKFPWDDLIPRDFRYIQDKYQDLKGLVRYKALYESIHPRRAPFPRFLSNYLYEFYPHPALRPPRSFSVPPFDPNPLQPLRPYHPNNIFQSPFSLPAADWNPFDNRDIAPTLPPYYPIDGNNSNRNTSTLDYFV